MKTLDELCAIYIAWNAEQGLNLSSADEHVLDETLTDAQRNWLIDFSTQWDCAADYERAMAEVEAEAFLNVVPFKRDRP